jgi:protein-disulfide isomerase
MTIPLHTLLMVVLAVIGLADSAYLTWDHFSHLAEAGYDGGLCGVGGGCELARTSTLSEIPMPGKHPGFPIALAGFAFYVVWLVLHLLWRRALGGKTATADCGPKVRPIHALQVALATAGLGYALFLGGWSLSQGSLCPFCSILYGVNLLIWLLTLLAGRLYPGGLGGVRGLGVGLLRALRGRPAFIAALTFGAVAAPGYAVYRAALLDAQAAHDHAAAAKPSEKHTFKLVDRPALGPENAPLQIVEFADFECPHCQQAFQHLDALTTALPNELRVTYMHFPLDEACNPLVDREFHRRACQLARIAECAHRQGRYVAVARMLYAKQRTTDDAGLLDAAAALGADRRELERCLQDETSAKAVRGDIDAGLDANVRGTPTLFLNGQQVRGELTVEGLRAMLTPAAPPTGGAP